MKIKKKIYIFEYIKNCKFIKNSNFWRNFIEDMIKKEFERIEKIFPEAFNEEKNINITENMKKKLNEVVFSQILTYVTNMKDFELDKRIILKIIDEFIEKYNYLSKNNIDNIYLMLTEGKDSVEKLREEYDPSLEGELTENEKINNEEKLKEDINREKDKSQNNAEGNEPKENIINENQNINGN